MAKPVKVEDSYTSDDFEDTVSISGSGSGKLPAKSPTTTSAPMTKIEESSDVYESEDFESLSKSQQ